MRLLLLEELILESRFERSGIEDRSPPFFARRYHLHGKNGNSKVPKTAVTAP